MQTIETKSNQDGKILSKSKASNANIFKFNSPHQEHKNVSENKMATPLRTTKDGFQDRKVSARSEGSVIPLLLDSRNKVGKKQTAASVMKSSNSEKSFAKRRKLLLFHSVRICNRGNVPKGFVKPEVTITPSDATNGSKNQFDNNEDLDSIDFTDEFYKAKHDVVKDGRGDSSSIPSDCGRVRKSNRYPIIISSCSNTPYHEHENDKKNTLQVPQTKHFSSIKLTTQQQYSGDDNRGGDMDAYHYRRSCRQSRSSSITSASLSNTHFPMSGSRRNLHLSLNNVSESVGGKNFSIHINNASKKCDRIDEEKLLPTSSLVMEGSSILPHRSQSMKVTSSTESNDNGTSSYRRRKKKAHSLICSGSRGGGGGSSGVASRRNSAVYPVAGAIIGTFIGGPVCALAGIKVGGLAAIGGSMFGFTTGRLIQEKLDRKRFLDKFYAAHPDVRRPSVIEAAQSHGSPLIQSSPIFQQQHTNSTFSGGSGSSQQNATFTIGVVQPLSNLERNVFEARQKRAKSLPASAFPPLPINSKQFQRRYKTTLKRTTRRAGDVS